MPTAKPKVRKLSPEGRERIRRAQLKRWRKYRANQKAVKSATAHKKATPKKK